MSEQIFTVFLVIFGIEVIMNLVGAVINFVIIRDNFSSKEKTELMFKYQKEVYEHRIDNLKKEREMYRTHISFINKKMDKLNDRH